MAPSLRATDNLYVDFLATIVEDTTGLAALDQVAEMEELISGHDEALKQFTLKTMSTTDSARSNMESIKKKFANERNTWRLLGKLYHDRLTPGGQSEEEGLATSSICSVYFSLNIIHLPGGQINDPSSRKILFTLSQFARVIFTIFLVFLKRFSFFFYCGLIFTF